MAVICDKREVSEARAGYVYNCRFVKPEKKMVQNRRALDFSMLLF